jgi:hypothetical protein
MNAVECLYLTVLLFRRILNHVKIHGHLTRDEKAQIMNTLHLLVRQFLTSGILHELGQVGELLGEFEVPRIQHGDLEEECTDSYYK